MVLLHNVFVYMYDLIWRLAREHLMVAGHGQGAGPGGLQEAAGRHHCMLSPLIIVIDKFYMLALLPILLKSG